MSSATPSVPLAVRLDTFERRTGRVEDAINTLLSRFVVPPIQKESADTPQPAPEPVAKSGPYVYKPLNLSMSEIRILAVQNNINEQDPIHWELVHMGLEDKAKGPRTPASMKTARSFEYTIHSRIPGESPRKVAVWLSRDAKLPSRRILKQHYVQCVRSKARWHTLPRPSTATLVLMDRRNLYQPGPISSSAILRYST